MNKKKLVACICEGSAERAIVNKLLDEDKLIFNRDNMLDNKVLKCRKAKDFEDRYLGKSFSEPISVYRVLDSRRERFAIGKLYKHKVKVVNVVTAPEIEILIIINEGKFQDYQKHKSYMMPSDYCKQVLGFKNVKNYSFVTNYFEDSNILLSAIKKYRRKSKVKKGELCLNDIIKEY